MDLSLERDDWRSDLEEYDLSAVPGPEAKRVSPVNIYIVDDRLWIVDGLVTRQTEPGVWPGVWRTWIEDSPKLIICLSMRKESTSGKWGIFILEKCLAEEWAFW